MAVKLVLTFKDATATSRKWVFDNAKSGVVIDDVKGLMNTMITNGSIYKYPPVSVVGAQLVTTTYEPLNVTD